MRKNKYKLYVSEGLADRRRHNMCLCRLDGKMFKENLENTRNSNPNYK